MFKGAWVFGREWNSALTSRASPASVVLEDRLKWVFRKEMSLLGDDWVYNVYWADPITAHFTGGTTKDKQLTQACRPGKHQKSRTDIHSTWCWAASKEMLIFTWLDQPHRPGHSTQLTASCCSCFFFETIESLQNHYIAKTASVWWTGIMTLGTEGQRGVGFRLKNLSLRILGTIHLRTFYLPKLNVLPHWMYLGCDWKPVSMKPLNSEMAHTLLKCIFSS